ncbi:MAG: metallophosphoesterase [Bacteroidales bacterium]|nr:metallophosphoesterase [Bacteroidales bacterium]
MASVLNSFAEFYSTLTSDDLTKDGPYILKNHDEFKIIWIDQGHLREEALTESNFNPIKKRFNFLFNYSDLIEVYSLKSDFNQDHKSADSIAVISDIHGEFDSYLHLLKSAGVIDRSLSWSFGNGHLVVLGDIFDRGDKVTEALWHLFGLEQQAEKAGGKVHLLLGNHEFMMFRGNTSEINKKYRETEKITSSSYSDLFSDDFVLGRWLRSKPVMISVGDILFVHGGVSPEMLKKNLSIKQVNRIFSTKILGIKLESINQDEECRFLNNASGPLWYRGYFEEDNFCECKTDSVLNYYGMKHIVVGHTPNQEIRTYHDCKITGVDSGLMYKQPGEILLIKNDIFYRIPGSGKRVRLN